MCLLLASRFRDKTTCGHKSECLFIETCTKNFGGTNLIVGASMTSPCSLNRSTTYL